MTPRLFRPLALALVLAACGGAAPQQEAVSLPHQSADAGTSNKAALAQSSGKSESNAAVPINDTDPVWGSRTAPVTIVEFSDFQCPFCARATLTLEQLRKDYGEQKLRIVFKNEPLPFHPNARPAAEAAATVRALGGNAAFWAFHDLAFNDQANLNGASYEVWAQKAGVSLDAFRAAIQAHRYAAKIDDDDALAKKLGVNGTPAFFINGVHLSGAQPIDKFKAIIDEQMTAAKAKLEKGVSPEDLYTVATKENFAKPEAEEHEPPEDTTTVWKVPVGTSPVLGPKTALVTIVELADFQCPFCKRVEPTLQQIKSQYGNDVRFVFKEAPLPFHKRAEPAAELALEARAEKGDTGFWAAHDKLFDAQPNLEDSDLARIASELKLDANKAKAAIAGKKWQSAIEKDELLTEELDANGTPHFFINGRRLKGAQPYDKFKTIIDEELVKTRALVKAGTKPENVYDEIMKAGKTPPPPEQETITVSGTAATKGPANAPVTILEIADFQDPYSKRVNATLDEVLKAYPTKVKLVWRHNPLPFHAQAELAAEASVEAFKQKGNAAFWKMHDAFFLHQTDPDGLSRASIDGYARTAGLDMKKFAQALDTGANASLVDADAKAAQNVKLTGTPSFVIGRSTSGAQFTGFFVVGAQWKPKFMHLVDLALGAHP